MRLFEKYKGLIGTEYTTDAIIKYGRFTLSQSTYKGGTTEYLNEIVVLNKFRYTWFSEKVTGDYS